MKFESLERELSMIGRRALAGIFSPASEYNRTQYEYSRLGGVDSARLKQIFPHARTHIPARWECDGIVGRTIG
jgi:hypothetical protein